MHAIQACTHAYSFCLMKRSRRWLHQLRHVLCEVSSQEQAQADLSTNSTFRWYRRQSTAGSAVLRGRSRRSHAWPRMRGGRALATVGQLRCLQCRPPRPLPGCPRRCRLPRLPMLPRLLMLVCASLPRRLRRQHRRLLWLLTGGLHKLRAVSCAAVALCCALWQLRCKRQGG